MRNDEDSEGIVRVTLRLPKNIHDRLVAMAATERRSLNAEMVYLLEQAADEATPPPPAPSDAL